MEAFGRVTGISAERTGADSRRRLPKSRVGALLAALQREAEMAGKKELPIGSKVVMELKEDGWFVYVDAAAGRALPGHSKRHKTLEEGVQYVRDEFDVQ